MSMRPVYQMMVAALLVLCGIAKPMVAVAQIPCTTTVSCAQAAVTAAAEAKAAVKVLTDRVLDDEKKIAASQVQYGNIDFPAHAACGNPVSVTATQKFPKPFPAGTKPNIYFGLSGFTRNRPGANYNFSVSKLNTDETDFTAQLSSGGGGACLDGASFSYVAIP
jgi:hypothetical protein